MYKSVFLFSKCVASWARCDAQWTSLAELERRCQDTSREIQMLSKRQEIFKNAIEGKLRVQSRASERLQGQIIEEIKEMEHKRTEEALEWVRKENDLWRYQSEKEEAKQLQDARKLRKDWEMAWAPPRNMSNWPDWEEAKSMEESEWRLEPEGEAKVPDIIVVSDAVQSTNVEIDGKSRREQAEERSFRREREGPGEEGEEVKTPKRKVIRVESEETQDYVR